jgi:predicted solute-binding protein
MSDQRISSTASDTQPVLFSPATEVPLVGCVSYLNAKPLIFGYPGDRLVLDVPSGLASRFAAGEFAAALLPIFDIFSQGSATLAEDISISCRGPVRSVVIASQNELHACEMIEEDPDSLTSNALARVLLAEYMPGFPKVVKSAEQGSGNAGRVMIGDRALEFRKQNPDWHFLDLGSLWFEKTGLPFVFAAWCFRRPASYKFAEQLRAVRDAGVAGIQSMTASAPDPQDAMDYLTKNIRYHLGDEEKQALRHFASLCLKHGLLETNPLLLWV